MTIEDEHQTVGVLPTEARSQLPPEQLEALIQTVAQAVVSRLADTTDPARGDETRGDESIRSSDVEAIAPSTDWDLPGREPDTEQSASLPPIPELFNPEKLFSHESVDPSPLSKSMPPDALTFSAPATVSEKSCSRDCLEGVSTAEDTAIADQTVPPSDAAAPDSHPIEDEVHPCPASIESDEFDWSNPSSWPLPYESSTLPIALPSRTMLEAQLEQSIQALRGQIDILELREEKLKRQTENYLHEIRHLHQQNRMLEELVNDLPKLYRGRFLKRLQPVKDRMARIRAENLHLHRELHWLGRQLVKQTALSESSRRRKVHLPCFGRRLPILPLASKR